MFFGGEISESAKGHEGAGGFSAECQAFDGISGRVQSAAIQVIGPTRVRPQARGWAGSDLWGDDKLVVVGGLAGDDASPVRLNDVWVLEPFK